MNQYSMFPDSLYAVIQQPIACSNPDCSQTGYSSVSVVCTSCEKPLNRPGNFFSRTVFYNVKFLRLLPLPIIALTVGWLHQSWTLYVMAALAVLLYFGMYLRRYRRQFRFFWVAGMLVFAIIGYQLYVESGPTSALTSGGLIEAYDFTVWQTMRRLDAVSLPLGLELGVLTSGAEANSQEKMFLSLLVFLLISTLFAVWFTRKRTRSYPSIISVIFWFSFLGLGAIMVWCEQQGLYRQTWALLRIATYISLSMLGSMVVVSILSASRQGSPTFLRDRLDLVCEKWDWHLPLPKNSDDKESSQSRESLGAAGKFLSSLVDPIIDIATRIATESFKLVDWLLKIAESLVKNSLKVIASLIDLVLHLSHRIYLIILEVIYILMSGEELFAAMVNLVRLLLLPLSLLVVAAFTLHRLSESTYSYMFGGGTSLLGDIAIYLFIIYTAMAGAVFVKMKGSAPRITLEALLQALKIYLPRALLMFLFYAWFLGLTSTLSGVGPFRIGPITIVLTAIVGIAVVMMLLMGRVGRSRQVG